MTEQERWTLWTCQIERCGTQDGYALFPDIELAHDPRCPECGGEMEPHAQFVKVADVEGLVRTLDRIAHVAEKSLVDLGYYRRPDLAQIAHTELAKWRAAPPTQQTNKP